MTRAIPFSRVVTAVERGWRWNAFPMKFGTRLIRRHPLVLRNEHDAARVILWAASRRSKMPPVLRRYWRRLERLI